MFTFLVMFLSLPKQWHPALKNIASKIGPVLDDDEERESNKFASC